MLPNELKLHLGAMTRLLYVVTEEEDRFVVDFHEQMKKHETRTWVYNAAFGLRLITDLIKDWNTRAHAVETDTVSIHDALIKIYRDDPKEHAFFYIITDPERWFNDPHVVRRVLNITHELHQDPRIIKSIIFVGPRRVIPDKLSRYIEVINSPGLSATEIQELVGSFGAQLQSNTVDNAASLFRGMTSYEIEQAITLSVARNKKSTKHRTMDSEFISEYRRNQIRKTDLVQLIDTDECTFENVGGADRFKKWVHESSSCWTEEGQKYGLRPPRGVLLVGVYGCGKSISAKALAAEWKLPLIQFEMGKLRSSGVGDSEGNLYRALRVVDSVSPCVMWIDEAEKTLSGSASSAQSDAGTTSRLLGILSTWTQESKTPVCIVMTANSLKTMPTEMVNRMPERFFFDIPDLETRIQILKIHAKNVGQDISDFNLAELAEKAEGLVGREIEQAVASSMTLSFNAKKPGLDEAILSRELEHKPRITKTMTDEIKDLVSWVGYDPEIDDGIRAHLASSGKSSAFKVLEAESELK